MSRTRNLVASAAFLVMCGGLSWAYPPLGLIVGGGLVFVALVWSHLRGPSDDAS